jgi:hypothetical protein
MIQHYLKVAFRNMWKYKSQTLISVVGMAIGFACFAMSALWIRYEMTYDSFHKNADQLYRVSVKDRMGVTSDGLTTEINVPLDLYLKKTFPEINNATRAMGWNQIAIEIDDVKSITSIICTDSSFLKMFDIKILAGNSDFMIYENKQIALTQEKTTQLFGNENPIGKTVVLCVGGRVYKTSRENPVEAINN